MRERRVRAAGARRAGARRGDGGASMERAAGVKEARHGTRLARATHRNGRRQISQRFGAMCFGSIRLTLQHWATDGGMRRGWTGIRQVALCACCAGPAVTYPFSRRPAP